jgi:hypothetical protein
MDIRENAGGQVSREWVTWVAGVGGLPQALNKFGFRTPSPRNTIQVGTEQVRNPSAEPQIRKPKTGIT